MADEKNTDQNQPTVDPADSKTTTSSDGSAADTADNGSTTSTSEPESPTIDEQIQALVKSTRDDKADTGRSIKVLQQEVEQQKAIIAQLMQGNQSNQPNQPSQNEYDIYGGIDLSLLPEGSAPLIQAQQVQHDRMMKALEIAEKADQRAEEVEKRLKESEQQRLQQKQYAEYQQDYNLTQEEAEVVNELHRAGDHSKAYRLIDLAKQRSNSAPSPSAPSVPNGTFTPNGSANANMESEQSQEDFIKQEAEKIKALQGEEREKYVFANWSKYNEDVQEALARI